MPSANIHEVTPRPVSTYDLESVEQLHGCFVEMSENDVKVVRGESVDDKVEAVGRLSEKLCRRLGVLASEGGLVVGLVTVTRLEDKVLSEARRLQSSEHRLY